MKSFLLLYLVLLTIIPARFWLLRPLYQDGDHIEISSQINIEPVQYDTSQYVKLHGLRIYLPKYPKVFYGDKVIIQGVVQGDKLNRVELIEHTVGTNTLYKFRNTIVDFYQSNLPQPHSSLVAGVALGSKQSIPTDFWNKLKKTGTIHIVVASGTNVSIVAEYILLALLPFLGRKLATPIALSGIWLYALLSGFDAPIVRATIMGSLAFGSQIFGRLYYTLNALFLSALLMLIVNPSWLFDWGFVMSFLATLGLIVFEPKIRSKLMRVPVIFREGLSTSIAAQIGVAPVLIFAFGQFNVLSPIYNMLILWSVTPITIIGMLSGLLSLLSPGLARLVLYTSYPFTLIFVKLVNIFSLIG